MHTDTSCTSADAAAATSVDATLALPRPLQPLQSWNRGKAWFKSIPLRFPALKRGLSMLLRTLPQDGPHNIWCSDDSLAWFRSLHFLYDADFIAAHASLPHDAPQFAKLWRTYTYCWAVRSALPLGGAIVDLGCYDGVTTDIVYQYAGPAASAVPWYLYDVFDPPSSQPRKWGHHPLLHATVAAQFSNRPNVHVIPGLLPDALRPMGPLGCLLLDLNDPATEVAVLSRLYDALLPGGLIILDDYGDSHFAASAHYHQQFFAARHQLIYESQSGQGIVVKR